MAKHHDRAIETTVVATHLDAIEAEMKRAGVWQSEPLAPEKMAFQQAFGMDTMAFTEWLQFVFLPRARSLLPTHGPWPTSSMVAVQATREFDGWGEGGPLLDRLRAFDALFGEPERDFHDD